MALKPFNSVAGYSVGEVPANIILANGDITTTNITTTGVSNLNSIGNVKITGGSSGQVISTDGAGNLSFITVSTAGLSNGTSNINILNNGNITFGVAGTANVGVFSSAGLNVDGYVTLTGLLTSNNANLGNAVTANFFIGSGANLTNINGANVTGTVANATYAVSAGSANSATNAAAVQSNTSTTNTVYLLGTGTAANGNVSLEKVSGITANFAANSITATTFVGSLSGAATTAGTVTTNAQPNITSVGTLSSLDVTGNVSAGNISANIANLTTANVTGNVVAGGVKTDNLYYANGNPWDLQQPAGSNNEIQYNLNGSFGASANFTFNDTTQLLNVTGNITATNIYANSGVIGAQTLKGEGGNISNIQGSNVSGAVAFATTANSVAGSNVSGQVANALVAGTVYTNAQPNITSVGTLTSLGVNGTVTANTFTSNVATGTAPLTVTSTTRVANLNVAYANVTDFINVSAPGTGTGYLIFANATTGNVAEWTSSGITSNLANNSITATTFVGGTLTAPYANGTTLQISGGLQSAANGLGGAVNISGGAGRGILPGGDVYLRGGPGNSTNNADGGNVVVAGGFGFGTGNGGVLTIGSGVATGADSNIVFVGGYGSGDGGEATFNGGRAEGTNRVGGTITINGGTGTGNGQPGNIVFRTSVPTVSGTTNQNLANRLVISGNVVNVVTSVAATSTTSGAFRVVGGMGVGGNVYAGAFYGSATGLTSIPGANVTGTVANATNATAVLNNVITSGTVYPTFISSTANGNYSLTSNTAYSANIANGFLGATLLGGTLTTAAQPNITSVGSLSSLTVTGNIDANNISTTNKITAGNGLQVSSGTLTVTNGNLDVTGNLNVTGNVNYSNVTDLVVQDPLIYIGEDNTGDTFDLGIVASYTEGTYQHTGIARNATTNRWTFFDGVVAEPTTVIDWANATYPTVQLGNLIATANANIAGYANVVGNITAGNISTGGALSVTGNANVGNLGTATAIITTGNITTINSGLMQNGNSNVTITANGNVTINAVGGARITATSTGANVTGTLGVSGNANVSNLGATAGVFTGNVTAGNANVTGQLISTVGDGTAPLVVTSTTRVANLNVAYANVADNINVSTQSSGNAYLLFGNALTGNIAETANAAFVANTTNGTLYATTFAGNLSATNANVTTANVSGNVILGNSSVTTSITWASLTTTSVSANQTIASLSVAGITGVEYLVKSIDATGSKYGVATVIAVTDGTNVDYSTFGTVNLGGYTGALAVNVVGGQLRLQVTPASSNSTVWTTQYRLI